MATARVIPEQDQQITINSQGDAHPSAVRIDNGQNVTFNNKSGATISILFEDTAISHRRVFNDIANLQNGESYTEAPLISDITVNYTISMNGNKPFAIEVGAGPLEISVTGTNPTPEIGAMPPNGEVLFQSADGLTHSLNWQDGDPFNPPINSVTPSGSSGTENGNKGHFPYTLSQREQAARSSNVAEMALQPMGGGGTIKVT
jgi:hypothetical protein